MMRGGRPLPTLFVYCYDTRPHSCIPRPPPIQPPLPMLPLAILVLLQMLRPRRVS